MKKIKTFINYFIWIPYAVSVGAFALYFRYYFTVKLAPNVEITEAINLVMERYLKIGLFSLFLGLLLTFIVKISKIIFNEDKYYNNKYPWTNLEEKKEEELKKEEEKFNIENAFDDSFIAKEREKEVEEVNDALEDDYVINENPLVDEKIVNDLEVGNKIKARFIDDDSKSLETIEDDTIIIPENKKQLVIKVDSSKVKIDGFRHCPKCNNLIVEDAVICVHCGVLLDETIKSKDNYKVSNRNKIFSPAKLAVDAIIILISFIIIILLCQKIETQKLENESNLNTKTTTISDILKK